MNISSCFEQRGYQLKINLAKPDAAAMWSKAHRWAICDWLDTSRAAEADENKEYVICIILNWSRYISHSSNTIIPVIKYKCQVPVLPVSRVRGREGC